MNAFVAKLSASGFLEARDQAMLDGVVESVRHVQAGSDLTSEGDRPDSVRIIAEGFACRYKVSDEGRRQIVAIMVPGDFCDLHVTVLGEMDHSVSTLSDCSVCKMNSDGIAALLANPRIARSLWWATLVDEAVLREWIVNLGSRNANKRIAHLICELHRRLSLVGLADRDGFSFPANQSDLGDMLGISNVHVNRTLKELRHQNLVFFERGFVSLPNLQNLESYCGFNPNYLHLKSRSHAAGPSPLAHPRQISQIAVAAQQARRGRDA